MPSSGLRGFSGQKYLSLETFRRNGQSVRTPVWFAASPDGAGGACEAKFYIYTLPDSGKVKRIRNNPRVRVAPCTVRGEIRGEWAEAEARMADGAEAEIGQRLLRKKYFPWKHIGDFFSRLQGRTQAVIVLRFDENELEIPARR
ncbi:MAG TPA: PPOX class F420-dependent oxidoreductase [Candidatus Acidoferrales bacterium]|nr:PPOX class F420-dependent oxidoreductase [Candidatus Acidoferrales bacterium]